LANNRQPLEGSLLDSLSSRAVIYQPEVGQAMNSRSKFHIGSDRRFQIESFHIKLMAAALAVMLAATMSLGVAPAAARRAPKHKAAPAAPAAALSQIHVLGDLPAPFVLDAHSAVMIDANSGAVLYAYNPDERMQPASLAKLMTFYLVLQALEQHRITPGTMVTVSKKAWLLSMNSSVSRMFLRVGQQVSVHDLLFGLMVSSGNDAAVTLAEYLGGSSEGFTAQMNAEAKKLGLTNTHFEDPDGLPLPGMYTTAADMVKLARALTKRFPDAYTYTSAKYFTFDKIRQPNFNSLLFHDQRVDGLKTGHVEEAGFHLVASANSNGMHLISAVLGTPSAFERRTQTEKLLDWGFRTFASVKPDWRKALPDQLLVYGGAANEVAVAPAAVPYVTVARGQEGKVSLQGAFGSKYLVAPVAKGQQVGALVLTVDGKEQSTIPVLAQASIAQGGLMKRLIDKVRMRL
jgi:serine-type D-Ala-D-Ala carboxypeptidase (penicillin-binding protein 5/6)